MRRVAEQLESVASTGPRLNWVLPRVLVRPMSRAASSPMTATFQVPLFLSPWPIPPAIVFKTLPAEGEAPQRVRCLPRRQSHSGSAPRTWQWLNPPGADMGSRHGGATGTATEAAADPSRLSLLLAGDGRGSWPRIDMAKPPAGAGPAQPHSCIWRAELQWTNEQSGSNCARGDRRLLRFAKSVSETPENCDWAKRPQANNFSRDQHGRASNQNYAHSVSGRNTRAWSSAADSRCGPRPIGGGRRMISRTCRCSPISRYANGSPIALLGASPPPLRPESQAQRR